MIQKGEVPGAHKDVVNTKALSTDIPVELRNLVDENPGKLRCYPFEEDAFKDFVHQLAVGDLSRKPSEVLIRLQKAAQRAMRYDKRVISSKVVQEINAEGF
jgi:hypothetical protein